MVNMIRLSLSREVEGKRPDETRQPAKLLALQWCQLRQKAKYLSFLRDEDKTFAKKVLPLLFRRGFKFFSIFKKNKEFLFYLKGGKKANEKTIYIRISNRRSS